MITRLSPLAGGMGPRAALSDALDHLKRAWAVRAERRASRPLHDIDRWSDQAEVAYYEEGGAARCP